MLLKPYPHLRPVGYPKCVLFCCVVCLFFASSLVLTHILISLSTLHIAPNVCTNLVLSAILAVTSPKSSLKPKQTPRYHHPPFPTTALAIHPSARKKQASKQTSKQKNSPFPHHPSIYLIFFHQSNFFFHPISNQKKKIEKLKIEIYKLRRFLRFPFASPRERVSGFVFGFGFGFGFVCKFTTYFLFLRTSKSDSFIHRIPGRKRKKRSTKRKGKGKKTYFILKGRVLLFFLLLFFFFFKGGLVSARSMGTVFYHLRRKKGGKKGKGKGNG